MLKTRVITALLLAGGLLSALFLLPRAGMMAIFVAIVGIAAWEWAGLLRLGTLGRWSYAVLTALPCIALLAFDMPLRLLAELWQVAMIFWLLVAPLWFRFKWSLQANFTGYLVGWLLLIPSWGAMAILYQRSPWLLLAAMALVWVADIAAYFSGRTLGRHKLAPTISPGKTWEGALGAVIGVLIYALAVGNATGHLAAMTSRQLLLAALGMLLLTAVSIVGDLFESLVKRQAGVKDSSALLPGHGGVLDRIDSLTSTLPLSALAAVFLLAPASGH